MNVTNTDVLTVGELKTQIRETIYASGEPENLTAGHDAAFQEAFAEIAKWCDCEKDANIDVWPFTQTFFKCGMTAIRAPRGEIRNVFTLWQEKYCHPVYYKQVEWPGPEQWARNRAWYTPPNDAGQPQLKWGLQQAEASTDVAPNSNPPTNYKRARSGVWALYDGWIYLAPWINSQEAVCVDWKGIKTSWKDADLINPDQDYRKCVKLFMQFAHERDYGSMERAAMFYEPASPSNFPSGYFADALADLMYQCRERTKVRDSKKSEDHSYWLARFEEEQINQGSPPADCKDQIYTGVWPNPNGNVTPCNTAIANTYYQSGNILNVWNWDYNNLVWQPDITT